MPFYGEPNTCKVFAINCAPTYIWSLLCWNVPWAPPLAQDLLSLQGHCPLEAFLLPTASQHSSSPNRYYLYRVVQCSGIFTVLPLLIRKSTALFVVTLGKACHLILTATWGHSQGRCLHSQFLDEETEASCEQSKDEDADLSVLCMLLLPQPMVPLTLAQEWREEPHLTDSLAFFCFTLLSFSFRHSYQKAGHLPRHHASFPGKPDGQCCRPASSSHDFCWRPGGHPQALVSTHSPSRFLPWLFFTLRDGSKRASLGVGTGLAVSLILPFISTRTGTHTVSYLLKPSSSLLGYAG